MSISVESQERRELMEQLQYLGEVYSTETALFQQVAAAHYGLGITDMKSLSILLREGPLPAGEIGNRLGLTSGSVTTLIDRLEGKELVKRQRDPNDRRKVVVVINQEKMLRSENIYQSMGEAFARLLANYSDDELKFLVDYHQQVIEMTRKEVKKLAISEA